MNMAHLVKMANQIGAFFETMPDRQQALVDLANHLKRSWEPRMRRELLSYITLHNENELKPIVSEAMSRNLFSKVLSNIHLVDNKKMPSKTSKNYSKTYKIDNFMQILKHNFKKIIFWVSMLVLMNL